MTTINRELLAGSWQSWLDKGTHRVGPYWLQLLWTVLLSGGIAAVFTVVAMVTYSNATQSWPPLPSVLRTLGVNLAIASIIGFICHALFEAGARLLGSQRIASFSALPRYLYYLALPLTGVAIGWQIALMLFPDSGIPVLTLSSPGALIQIIGIGVLINAAIWVYMANRHLRIVAERRAAEAQLRLLQGQIEPHFLFNTLANVQALIDVDAAKAKAMLEAFTDYLRGSLGALRGDHSTLGNELEMAGSYLSLLKTRMEDRLSFSVDVDASLHKASLPPLLLQPLIENAIHHGLEPKLEGGRVRLAAQREGDDLLLTVSDNGLGTAAPKTRRGAGMALANLRERLAARYGRQACLTLSDAHPGTVVTIRLPLEFRTP